MEILFLGTSAAVPSKEHSTSCIAVRSGSDIVLLDCGEGSQRQLMLSPFSFMKIRAILVTHLHGDHVFGLPGLIQTMSLSNRTDPLLVCGPPGTAHALEVMMSVTEGEATYDVEVREVSGGEAVDVNGMTVMPYATDHGIASVGYVVQDRERPGKLDAEKARSMGVTSGRDMARLKRGETVNGVRPEDVIGPVIPGLRVAYSGRPPGRRRDNPRGDVHGFGGEAGLRALPHHGPPGRGRGEGRRRQVPHPHAHQQPLRRPHRAGVGGQDRVPGIVRRRRHGALHVLLVRTPLRRRPGQEGPRGIRIK